MGTVDALGAGAHAERVRPGSHRRLLDSRAAYDAKVRDFYGGCWHPDSNTTRCSPYRSSATTAAGAKSLEATRRAGPRRMM